MYHTTFSYFPAQGFPASLFLGARVGIKTIHIKVTKTLYDHALCITFFGALYTIGRRRGIRRRGGRITLFAKLVQCAVTLVTACTDADGKCIAKVVHVHRASFLCYFVTTGFLCLCFKDFCISCCS